MRKFSAPLALLLLLAPVTSNANIAPILPNVMSGQAADAANIATLLAGRPLTIAGAAGSSLVIAFPAQGDSCSDIKTSAPLTITFSGGTPGKYQEMTVIIRQGSTPYPVTLPVESSTMKWIGGAPPIVSTGANTITVFRMFYSNGTIFGGV